MFGVKEFKKYVILMIRGQGHHLRSPKGQYPITTGKFGIKSFRGGII